MNDIPQETFIRAIRDETLYEMASEPELLNVIEADMLDAMEAVVKANPQFKDMTFVQLSRLLLRAFYYFRVL